MIAGVDLLPGSSPEGEPRYAVVILQQGRVRARFSSVTRRDLVRLIDEYSVDVIAIDNALELAKDWTELANFLSLPRIPPRLVEVTRIRGKSYPLAVLASSLGLLEGHAPPLRTAEAAARMAYMGVGSEVLLYEEETHILVGRARSPVQGGMSRERFRRNVELAVLEEHKRIEEKLKRHGLDYDVFVERGESGLKSSVFLVYAPPSIVRRIVHPRRGLGSVVKIRPVIRSKVEYLPLGQKKPEYVPPKRYLIVGVDPGMWTGLAILDLTGRVLLLKSQRWLGRGQIIREVMSHGTAALVATDVNPPPPFVKKLAASLNAPLYYPPRSLSVEEKRSLASEVPGIKVKDSHQRDALAAALKAYKHFADKFKQIERRISELGMPLPRDEAKYLLIKGYSVSAAVKRLAERYLLGLRSVRIHEAPERREAEELASYVRLLESELVELRTLVEKLSEEKKRLLEELSALEDTLNRLARARRASAARDRAVMALERRVEGLLAEVSRLKGKVESLERERAELAELLLKSLKRELVWGYVISGRDRSNIPGKCNGVPLLVTNPRPDQEFVERIVSMRPEAVILPESRSDLAGLLRERGVPVLERLPGLRVLGDVFVVSSEDAYRRALEAERKRVAEVSRLAARRRVISLIKSYREERARVLRRLAGESSPRTRPEV